MDWGSAPAWAALVVATAAFIVSFKAMRNGARSAKAAENSAAASLRSAAASEATLADRRAEADRENRERDEAAKPRPDVHIEYVSGDTWALRNTGTTVADGVTVTERGWPQATTRPESWSLAAGEAKTFLMAGDMSTPVPPQLWLTWAGQDEPVARAVQPRTPRVRKSK